MKLDPTKIFDVRYEDFSEQQGFSFRSVLNSTAKYQLIIRTTGISALYADDLLLAESNREETEEAVQILKELYRLESVQRRERLLNAITRPE